MFPWNVMVILRMDDVSLKAILAVNIQGRCCLSAFSIRAWFRMIIAVEVSAESVEPCLFHIYWFDTTWEVLLCLGQKHLFFNLKGPYICVCASISDVYINMHCSKSLQCSLIGRNQKLPCHVEEISRRFFRKLYSPLESYVCEGISAYFLCCFLCCVSVINNKMIHPVYY